MQKGIMVPPKQKGNGKQVIRDVLPLTGEMFPAIQGFILSCNKDLIRQIKKFLPRGWRALCLLFALDGETRHNCQEALREFNKEFSLEWQLKAISELVQLMLCILGFQHHQLTFYDNIVKRASQIKEGILMRQESSIEEKETKDLLSPFVWDFLVHIFSLLAKKDNSPDLKDEYRFKGKMADYLVGFANVSRKDARRIWDTIRQDAKRKREKGLSPTLISQASKGPDGEYTLRNPQKFAIKGEQESPFIEKILGGAGVKAVEKVKATSQRTKEEERPQLTPFAPATIKAEITRLEKAQEAIGVQIEALKTLLPFYDK